MHDLQAGQGAMLLLMHFVKAYVATAFEKVYTLAATRDVAMCDYNVRTRQEPAKRLQR